MNSHHSGIVEFDLLNRSFKTLSLDTVRDTGSDTTKIYWIHCNLNDEHTFKQLIKKLSLPDDVVKLCGHSDAMPQVIENEESLTMEVECLLSTNIKNNKKINLGELIIHLTPHYCFTASYKPIPAVFEFIEGCSKSIKYAKTTCFILFLLLDNIINDYAKLLFNFELLLESMDERVRKMNKNIYNEVTFLKKNLMRIKRYMIAIREMLMRISGRKISVVSRQCRLSLARLSNHGHLIVHEIDSIRDILNSLLSQIDNNLMQTMTSAMRILTAFAAVFMPLTFIAGIYGMNFHNMPELNWRFGYLYVWVLIAVCAALMLYIFKRKNML